MSVLAEMMSLEFAQRALVAAMLLAVLSSLVGFFVVLRRLAFVTVGLSHAALGGVALGVVLGQSPVLWAIVFAVAVALGMAALGAKGMSEDTSLGVFFPAAMAFGVLLIGVSPGWQRDLLAYLFGSVLAVTPADLWLLAGTTLVVTVIIVALFKELLYITFDEEGAHAAGLPVEPLRRLLLVICAVTVVVAIKVVGVILVSALLVIPAAAAGRLTYRWQGVLAGSFVVAAVSLVGGLAASFAAPGDLNVPAGAAAVLIAATVFGLCAAVGRVRR